MGLSIRNLAQGVVLLSVAVFAFSNFGKIRFIKCSQDHASKYFLREPFDAMPRGGNIQDKEGAAYPAHLSTAGNFWPPERINVKTCALFFVYGGVVRYEEEVRSSL